MNILHLETKNYPFAPRFHLFVLSGVRLLWLLPLIATLLLLPTQSKAETIYNNSTNDLKVRFNPALVEVGDEIILAGAGRFLTNFSFEYWGSATALSFAGSVQVRVRFYQNDGEAFNGYRTPHTLFYDSDWFGIQPTERNTLIFKAGSDFSPGGLYIPVSNFTWSVQFQGLGAGDIAGIDIYSPIVVGQGYPDYWEHTLAGWQLMTNHAAPMNFAAVFQASEVPALILPELQISHVRGKVVLSWPLWAYDYVPEFNVSLTGGSWTLLPDLIYRSNDNFVLTNTPTGIAAFYRLRRQ